MASSTAVTVKLTEAWPAGMVTVAGTVASVMSSLASVTISSPVVSVLRETVALLVPVSVIEAESMFSVSVGTSSSVTSMLSVPLVRPAEEAVIVGVCVPSTIASSTAMTVKLTDAWPAGMVTVAGTVASVVSSLVSVTISSPVVSVFRETVALLDPVSVIEAESMFSVNAGMSSSVTSMESELAVKPVKDAVIVGVCVPSTSPTMTFRH